MIIEPQYLEFCLNPSETLVYLQRDQIQSLIYYVQNSYASFDTKL